MFSASSNESRHCVRLLQVCIAKIDALINKQLNSILHHPRLQRLEAAWRGLHHVCHAAQKQSQVQVRLLSVSWLEICRDAERALEFDQSALFKLIYSEEFDRPGGTPFGALIGDYSVDHSHRHLQALQLLAQIGAAAFCPVVLNASPQLFGLETFAKLTQRLDLSALFLHPEYTAWRQLRQREDARFLMLTLPYTSMRIPYASEITRLGGLHFREEVSRIEHVCWGHASFAFACVLIREFGQTHWFSHLRGAPKECYGGGVVTYLPNLNLHSSSPFPPRPSTDIIISDANERRLAEQGLAALCHLHNTDLCAFFSVPSLYAHKQAVNDHLAA
ncbi:MAG TPA: type VI secretion system contractile sheath large subunit, partial [Pseudomonadales bacterium]|nr:type VI secretion system contractile sheath large subunit [Pseudomonadales bacterium]